MSYRCLIDVRSKCPTNVSSMSRSVARLWGECILEFRIYSRVHFTNSGSTRECILKHRSFPSSKALSTPGECILCEDRKPVKTPEFRGEPQSSKNALTTPIPAVSNTPTTHPLQGQPMGHQPDKQRTKKVRHQSDTGGTSMRHPKWTTTRQTDKHRRDIDRTFKPRQTHKSLGL